MSESVRVALYCRVISPIEEICKQRIELEQIASTRGWTIVKVFKEGTVNKPSGRSQDSALEGLLKAAGRREFAAVAVWSIDQLGQSLRQVIETVNQYEITVYGEKPPGREPKLRDIRARDKNDLPVYRKYGQQQLPVYERPVGITTLEKNRHIGEWQTCIWVDQQMASDMLAVLIESRLRPVYVSIHERKHDRRRWVQSLQIQTNDPATE